MERNGASRRSRGARREGHAARAVLAEMDAVIPWRRLLGLIGPHYPKAGNGRQPLGLEKMLRIYFLQPRLKFAVGPPSRDIRDANGGANACSWHSRPFDL